MNGFLTKQNGGVMVGILVVVVIIAALYWGSSLFYPNSTDNNIDITDKGVNNANILDIYKNSMDDLDEIKDKAEARQDEVEVELDEITLIANTEAPDVPAPDEEIQSEKEITDLSPAVKPTTIYNTDKWRIYEKSGLGIHLLYHKDWYYDRDEPAEKDLEYILFVGFAEGPEILAAGRDYPIELIVQDADIEWKYRGYSVDLIKKDKYNRRYLLRTSNQEKYQEIVDIMASTFISQ